MFQTLMQVSSTVVWAEHSGELSNAITDGKRIIITTIEKFPYALSQLGEEHRNHKFATKMWLHKAGIGNGWFEYDEK